MIDRRTFLSRLGLAASAIALTRTASAVAAAPTVSDAPALDLVLHNEDAAIFALQRQYRKARRADAKALRAYANAEEAHYAGLPPRPEKPGLLLDWTDEQKAQFLTLTVGEMRDGKHPLFAGNVVANRQYGLDASAWEKAERASRRRLGLAAHEREVCRTTNALDRVARRLLRTRANTAEGMLVKISVSVEVKFDDGILERELAKDLRALKRRRLTPTA